MKTFTVVFIPMNYNEHGFETNFSLKNMPIIHDFEEHNFTQKEGGSLLTSLDLPVINKKRYGNGIADIIPAITNIIGNNKELISNVSNVAKTVGSIADASTKVNQAVKSAKELNQLKEIQKKNMEKKEPKKKKDQSEISKILDEHKNLDPKGDGVAQPNGSGFHSFSDN